MGSSRCYLRLSRFELEKSGDKVDEDTTFWYGWNFREITLFTDVIIGFDEHDCYHLRGYVRA